MYYNRDYKMKIKLKQVLLLMMFLGTKVFLFSQIETKININQIDVITKASLSIDSKSSLFVDQEYIMLLNVNFKEDVILDVKNAKIEFIEGSKLSTGPLLFKITPLDTGKAIIDVGRLIDAENIPQLGHYFFQVRNYSMPPIYIDESNQQFLTKLNEKSKITCHYPEEMGVFEEYAVKSWEARINDNTFTGKGNQFSEDFIKYINQVKDEALLLKLELEENNTGFEETEAVFYIR